MLPFWTCFRAETGQKRRKYGIKAAIETTKTAVDLFPNSLEFIEREKAIQFILVGFNYNCQLIDVVTYKLLLK